MQFFRKVYKGTAQYQTEIINDLCQLDFVSAEDGSEYPNGQFGDQELKWKHEPILHQQNSYFLCRGIIPTTFGNALRIQTIGLGEPGLATFEGNLSLFFIPLINNSFFMRARGDKTETAIPYFPNFLDLDLDSNNEHYVSSIYTYIGLLNSNISDYSPFIYCLFNGNGLNNAYNLRNCYLGRNQTFVPEGFDTPYKHGNDINNPNCKFWDLESVSVSAGTCVLTKVPYQNAYIDGLYYIVVSPQESVDGKFFSFGGRNFLGAGRNLVVELPSN